MGNSTKKRITKKELKKLYHSPSPRTWALSACLFLLIIHIAFSIEAPFQGMVATWNSGDIISFAGTLILGFAAWTQSKIANEMNKRILDIESNRYMLEMRPFALVTGYRVYVKRLADIYSQSKDIFIMVSDVPEDPEGSALCIEMSFTNTTNLFMTLEYFEAESEDGVMWENSPSLNLNSIISLPPGTTSPMCFYAPKAFFESMLRKVIRFSYIMENCYGQRYMLHFEMIILFLHQLNANEFFIHLDPNFYTVARVVPTSDGRLIEKVEVL